MGSSMCQRVRFPRPCARDDEQRPDIRDAVSDGRPLGDVQITQICRAIHGGSAVPAVPSQPDGLGRGTRHDRRRRERDFAGSIHSIEPDLPRNRPDTVSTTSTPTPPSRKLRIIVTPNGPSPRPESLPRSTQRSYLKTAMRERVPIMFLYARFQRSATTIGSLRPACHLPLATTYYTIIRERRCRTARLIEGVNDSLAHPSVVPRREETQSAQAFGNRA